MLTTLRYYFYTEWLLHWRRSQEWLYPLSFFLIMVSLFPLAFSPDPALLKTIMPGGIWLAALLASFLSMEHLFYTDREEGMLEQFMLAQPPLAMLLLAKLAAQWVVTELPLVLLAPLLGFLFHLSANAILALFLSLLIGTPILTMLGSLGAALTLGLRQPGMLLGLLLLPLVIPVLIFGVTIVQQASADLSWIGGLSFLAGLMIMSVTLLPWVVAATLQIGMDD